MSTIETERTGSRVEQLPPSYREEVDAHLEDPLSSSVSASVVVVTYRTDRDDFERLLTALDEQTVDDFEVIVVDNGNEWSVGRVVQQFDRVTAYAALERNCGVTVGRNLGAHLALSSLVIFVDDDGIPERDFVAAHRRAHRGDVVGVRGRVVPDTDTVYNRRQSWYDLGDERMPYYLNVEGNCSCDRQAFLSVGGFEEDLGGRAGHEGIELTYRLFTEGDYTRDQFVYDPAPVLYHDVASDVVSYVTKRIEREHNRDRIEEWHPELRAFLEEYPASSRVNPLSLRDRVAVALLDRFIDLGCALRRVGRRVRAEPR